jgi:uncharacterized membrane protein
MTMKRLCTGLLVITLTAFIGCNESKTGGPGATSHDSDKLLGKSDDTFKISAPSTATNVKQGQKNTLTFTVKRGKDFKQDVKITFEGSTKLTFDPKTVESKASDKGDVSVEVMPDDEAPLGKQTITVKATPKDGGSSTDATFVVNVEKK